MSDLITTIVPYFIPAVSGLAAGWMGYVAARRKNNAESRRIEADAKDKEVSATARLEQSYVALVERLEKRVDELALRVTELEDERDSYHEEVLRLGNELARAQETIRTLQVENYDLKTRLSVLQRQVASSANYNDDNPTTNPD